MVLDKPGAELDWNEFGKEDGENGHGIAKRRWVLAGAALTGERADEMVVGKEGEEVDDGATEEYIGDRASVDNG